LSGWFSSRNKSTGVKAPRKITFQASGNMIVRVPCVDRPLLKMAENEKGRELSLQELYNLTLIDPHQRRLLETLLDMRRTC
jgi:hypothetical protein